LYSKQNDITAANNPIITSDAGHSRFPRELLELKDMFSQTIQHPDTLLTTARLQLVWWKIWFISLYTTQQSLIYNYNYTIRILQSLAVINYN